MSFDLLNGIENSNLHCHIVFLLLGLYIIKIKIEIAYKTGELYIGVE